MRLTLQRSKHVWKFNLINVIKKCFIILISERLDIKNIYLPLFELILYSFMISTDGNALWYILNSSYTASAFESGG